MLRSNIQTIRGFIEGFNDKFFNGWSYDLRLGNQAYITSRHEPCFLTDENPFVLIKPGEFALLITQEKIKLDKYHMAFISVKMSYKRRGLVNISGFHVDPTYYGNIIFSVYNAGPNEILLKKNDPVFMIFFEQLEGEYTGELRNKGYSEIPVSFVADIRGMSASLSENATRLDRLENMIKIYAGIGGIIISALIAYILAT